MRKVLALSIGVILLFLNFGTVQAVEQINTWTGSGSGGSYADPKNWSLDIVPCNFATIEFNVIIPPGFTVNMDTSDCEINKIDLGSDSGNDSQLNILSGTSLTVSNDANIYGIINANSGTFSSTPFNLLGDRARIWGENGASLRIGSGDPSNNRVYHSHGLWYFSNNYRTDTYYFPLFTADGIDTDLDLSSIESIDAGFNDNGGDYCIQQIIASTGGTIDLSGATTIEAPKHYGDRIDLISNGTSEIDLSALETLNSAGRGVTRFEVNESGSMTMPALQTASQVLFVVNSGGKLSVNGSDPVAYASPGIWYFSNNYRTETYYFTLFNADGTGSMLDLSSIQSIDAGFNDNGGDYCVQQISASTAGTIDLSGLKSVQAPKHYGDRIDFINSGNSSIDLASLEALTSVGRGATRFVVQDAGVLTMPSLQTAEQVLIDVISGGNFHVNGDQAVTYASPGIWYFSNNYRTDIFNFTLLRAEGDGSLLDLSSVDIIDAGFNDNGGDYCIQQIKALAGGKIDLSGLKTITAPKHGGDRIDFIVGENGELDMSSLININSAGSGKTIFDVQAGRLILGTYDPVGTTDVGVAGINSDPQTATLEIIGDINLNNPNTLNLSEATFIVGGNLEFSLSNEEKFTAADSIVQFSGSGEQHLEVGGLDLDVFVDYLPNDNYGFGQMIVGQTAKPAVVRLRDRLDNGNGFALCQQLEALYLFGLGEKDPNGLKIVDGSTLILDRINVYTLENDEWIHINKLFLPGENKIAYDDGFIELGWVPGDIDSNNGVDGSDLVVLIDEFGRNDCGPTDPCQADFYGDGDVDDDDLACFASNFGRSDD